MLKMEQLLEENTKSQQKAVTKGNLFEQQLLMPAYSQNSHMELYVIFNN